MSGWPLAFVICFSVVVAAVTYVIALAIKYDVAKKRNMTTYSEKR